MKAMRCLLGIDLGTTAIKVALFDVHGKRMGASTCEYELYTPCSDVIELATEVYWDTFRICLQDVLQESKIAPESIVALSISAQSETLVPVDGDGNALRNAIVWMDTRAQDQSRRLGERFSRAEINRITGQTDMMAIWPCAKILWLKENEPDIFVKTKKFLLLEDYFIHRLSGGWYGEGSLWSSSVMWDITGRVFWKDMLQEIGIDESHLPTVIDSGVDVGMIIPSIAKELGLTETTRVVTGGLDGALGAMGVGNVQTGVFTESGGSSLTACLLHDRPFFDKKLEIPCFYSPVKDTYLLTAFSSGGICYRWMRDKFCSEEMAIEGRGGPDAYFLMDKQAESVPAGCEGLTILPHFLGAGMPDTDSRAKCTITGLTLRHTKAHIIRGFMESVAIVLRRMVESLEMSGISITEIRSMGGSANSKLWCQIKSNAIGKMIITLRDTDYAACLGAAMLAGVGVGIWDSAEAAYKGFHMEADKTYLPEKNVKETYDALYRHYRILMKTFKEINTNNCAND